MKRSSVRRVVLTHCLLLVAIAAWVAAPVYAQAVKCSQDHPDKRHRAESVAKRGDARMTLSVAGHTTTYAQQRFNLQGLITQADIDRVIWIKGDKGGGEMYNFLKWKLGGPAAVAAQFIGAGYEHFDRAYSDEAAAILLGIISVGQGQPELKMPPWMVEYLKKGAGQSKQAVSNYLQKEWSLDAATADTIGAKVAEVAVAGVARNVAAYMPKKYDVPNRAVEDAIRARRGGG